MTLVELAALAGGWQERLGLRDWRISVVPADAYALGKESRSASVEWDLCEKAARLSVLPAGHPALADLLTPYDEEESVVHELIHLLLAGQPRPTNEAETTLLEQAINVLARALVGLKRAAAERSHDHAPGSTGPGGVVRSGGDAQL